MANGMANGMTFIVSYDLRKHWCNHQCVNIKHTLNAFTLICRGDAKYAKYAL